MTSSILYEEPDGLFKHCHGTVRHQKLDRKSLGMGHKAVFHASFTLKREKNQITDISWLFASSPPGPLPKDRGSLHTDLARLRRVVTGPCRAKSLASSRSGQWLTLRGHALARTPCCMNDDRRFPSHSEHFALTTLGLLRYTKPLRWRLRALY